MAIGLGHMFGFRFLENFNYPYLSQSITEFWHRWHISLSTWFREYVYIPLGGNRAGTWRHVRNISAVWLLTGIWHGASWNFVLWGGYYGILLLAEKFILGNCLKKLPAVFRHMYCMFFVMLGWNIFAFDNLGNGVGFMKALFGLYGQSILNRETIYLLYNNLAVLALCVLGSTMLPRQLGCRLHEKLREKAAVQTVLQNAGYAGLFLLSVAWIVDATFNPFLYFRF